MFMMNLFARLAQERWAFERNGCREFEGYRCHTYDLESAIHSEGPNYYKCLYCGAELQPWRTYTFSLPLRMHRVRPRRLTRLMGWLGGLGKHWWKQQ